MAAEVGGVVEAKVAGAAMAARTAEWVEAAQAAEVLEAVGLAGVEPEAVVTLEEVARLGVTEAASERAAAEVALVAEMASEVEVKRGSPRECRSRQHCS